MLFPTPQARDGDNRGPANPARRRELGHQVSLHDAVHELLTSSPDIDQQPPQSRAA
ncbi:hypothetical protein [Nocardia aurantiaca]|uniref:hypothetical protein n=1 Tax=Nocardia aurantiaca TaxID=2675850 RepID=UPI001E45DBE2|nr:hypothetical protein [Nocardia aurantiaca]